MKSLNIAIFTECYHPIINGVIVSIDTYVKEFKKLGHKVYIFAPSSPKYKDKEDYVFRFLSLPYPVPVEYRFPLPIPQKLLHKIKDLNIEVVHTQTPFFIGAIAKYVSLRNNIPLIFTYHTQYDKYSHYVPLPQNSVKKTAISWSRIFCNRCNWIIAPSQEIKNFLESIGITTPVEAIPTGIDLDEFNNLKPQEFREKIKVGKNEKVLITAGRLAKEKNMEFILRSFRLILNEYENIKLLIIGGGPYQKALEKYNEKLNLKENTIFTGAVPKKEVIQYCAASDIFVFASVTETQGLVILEAMATGKPIVAIESTGVNEVVEDGVEGFLCPPDENIFKEKVIELLINDNLRKKMEEKVKIKARQFSSSSSAQKIVAIYEKAKRSSGLPVCPGTCLCA